MRSLFLIYCFIIATPAQSQQKALPDSAISVYITFDDGPMKASHYLIEAIQRDSIPVAVFAVGRQVYKNAENSFIFQWYRTNPFVELVNHSFSHANGKYKSYYQHPSKVVADIVMNEDTLGLTSKIARLPGRNLWRINGRKRHDLNDAAVAGDSLVAKGYSLFGWDMEWCYDTSGVSNYSAAQMMEQLHYLSKHGNSFIAGHIVILCHDPMLLNKGTRMEFENFIKKIKADPAYRFRFISEYPATNFFAGH